jgi:hypothetical protein
VNNIKLFDYTDTKDRNVMQKWAKKISLGKRDRARLDSKIDMLLIARSDLPPGLLQNTKNRHILELAVNGQRALRPMLCRGPFDMNGEFTFLLGAIEKDVKYIPADALVRADNNRDSLLNKNGGRCTHERFKKQSNK